MRHRAAILLLALALPSCGSSPKTHFYTLDAVPPAGPLSHSDGSGSMQVGHVDLPATLDRLSIVTRGSGGQVNVSDQDRWAAPLDELVQRALTADLRQRLPEGEVLAPGDPTPAGARTLTISVQRFTADASGHVVLDADWTLQQPGKRARTHHESIETTVNGEGGGDIAEAMSRALGKLADRIAAS